MEGEKELDNGGPWASRVNRNGFILINNTYIPPQRVILCGHMNMDYHRSGGFFFRFVSTGWTIYRPMEGVC